MTTTTLTPEHRRVVRSQVQGLLARSPTFADLSPDKREELATGLETVVGYLADPRAGQVGEAMAAKKEKDGAEKTADRLSKESKLVGQEFEAGALKQGVEGFDDLVDTVDFPEFVAGLISGVFDSIVNASIRQMEAYGELVKGVVQSVSDFATENITPNQARDWMVGKHAGKLRIDVASEGPRLAMGDNVDEDALQGIGQEYGLSGGVDLSEPESEAQLVRAAQLEMAKSRQKMLATMVMMGINRIVVTDGLINAKVVFDVKTTDTAARRAQASMQDRKDASSYDYASSHTGKGWWGGTSSASGSGSNSRHRTTVSSAVDTTSEAKAEMKAKLSGEVRVNFKSETVNLDMLASQQQAETIKSTAQR